jgi:hypothetical protein
MRTVKEIVATAKRVIPRFSQQELRTSESARKRVRSELGGRFPPILSVN